jgi:hypothetical protein
MKKTTLYLPDDLKKRIEAVARQQQRPEADVIREAIADAVRRPGAPPPRVPLTGRGLGDPTVADRVDELLENFGR